MSESLSTSKRNLTRQLRERKQKKLYSDDWALGDEEIEGRRTFSISEKLENSKFSTTNLVKEMHGPELTLAYIQRYGFQVPLLFREKTGLGLRVPTSNFTINDVRMCVGSRRLLDVMDVNTQKNVEMTMKEWQRYYEEPNKDKLLNVISLEFSHTKLENYIQTPSIVRQIDWVDCVWPRHLKEAQTESTNLLEDMMYPKVQKYCLMSVKGCYTDFHVDFGGTSVWYHILKGGKVFWLIPPTEKNMLLYEQWVLSGKQSDIFFGDTVEKCARIQLHEGNTFFIPTGWIHAVYTPRDSLVFGGNFLHSFGVEKQLKTAQVEDITKVPQKFRYPFFTEMLWYVLERYVHCLLGRTHISTNDQTNNPDPHSIPSGPHIHLTQQELHGLKAIVMYLHSLPTNKKNVPELIRDPIALITDVRTLVGLHRHDDKDLAITGASVLQKKKNQQRQPLAKSSGNRGLPVNSRMPPRPSPISSKVSAKPGTLNSPPGQQPIQQPGQQSIQNGDKGGPRRRRTRCKKCEACQRSDCGECSFCLDMVKFGGPGRAKQTCNMRQCLQPMLPVTAACAHCGLDGWGQTPVMPLQKGLMKNDGPSALMECSVCYEIAHPGCIQRFCAQISGIVNEDMPNSWECPVCCKSGKNTDYRPRHFRARQKSSDMRRMSISSDASSALDNKFAAELVSESSDNDNDYSREKMEVKTDAKVENKDVPSKIEKDGYKDFKNVPIKKRRSSENTEIDTSTNDVQKDSKDTPVIEPPRKLALRTQLAQQLSSNSNRILKKPLYVVRPAPLQLQNFAASNFAMDKRCLLPIFKHLSPTELFHCSLVCKTWAQLSIDPILWKKMDFTHVRLTAAQLRGIVRRQPENLTLNWSPTSRHQLAWLLSRLTVLKQLSLRSVNVQTALALRSCYCPPLQTLDLSFVTGLNDLALREILGPNNDSRRGLTDEKSKLRNLRDLKLSGTDITDIAMRYVTQYLPNVTHLNISLCARVTDAGIAQLSTKPAQTVQTLVSLDLSHCKLVTELSLDHLTRCENLIRLDLRHCTHVSTQAVIKFAAKSEKNLHVKDIKLVDQRSNPPPTKKSNS